MSRPIAEEMARAFQAAEHAEAVRVPSRVMLAIAKNLVDLSTAHEALADDLQAAVALLRDVEWSDDLAPACRFCNRHEEYGHDPDCSLGKFLAAHSAVNEQPESEDDHADE